MTIMSNTTGSVRDAAFYLRKTYLYNDSEDMEEFEGLLGSDLPVSVEYFDDHVDVMFRPDR